MGFVEEHRGDFLCDGEDLVDEGWDSGIRVKS